MCRNVSCEQIRNTETVVRQRQQRERSPNNVRLQLFVDDETADLIRQKFPLRGSANPGGLIDTEGLIEFLVDAIKGIK